MKLDYIDEINEHGEDLVRLYDFTKEEAQMLKQAIETTILANNDELQLHTLEFIEPRNCYLTLRVADNDEGILTLDKINFYCFLSNETYKKLVVLMEPFCKKDLKAYQFLYDLDTPTDFILSPAGTW